MGGFRLHQSGIKQARLTQAIKAAVLFEREAMDSEHLLTGEEEGIVHWASLRNSFS